MVLTAAAVKAVSVFFFGSGSFFGGFFGSLMGPPGCGSRSSGTTPVDIESDGDALDVLVEWRDLVLQPGGEQHGAPALHLHLGPLPVPREARVLEEQAMHDGLGPARVPDH